MTDAIAEIKQDAIWRVIVWLIMWYIKAPVRNEKVNNNNESIYIAAAIELEK